MNNNQDIRQNLLKSTKIKALAVGAAIVAAVALPQAFHLLGAISGLGTSLGETFLPMHISIIIIGLIGGVWAGLAAGITAPLISFALTGMPNTVMLPFILIEVTVYGVTAGLISKINMHNFFKLLIVQVSGRALRSIAVFLSFFVFNGKVHIASVWTSILTGLPGILLQWALIPLILFWLDKRFKFEQK